MSLNKQRVGNTNCCVVGCSNKYGNTPRTVQFHNFPLNNHISQSRREKWIINVNRKNEDGSLWTPTKYSRICSEHFVGNKKSDHPQHPAYIPTLFPTHKSNFKPLKGKTRNILNEGFQFNEIAMSLKENSNELQHVSDVTCQTENYQNKGKILNETFVCYSYIKENSTKVDSCIQTNIKALLKKSKNVPKKFNLSNHVVNYTMDNHCKNDIEKSSDPQFNSQQTEILETFISRNIKTEELNDNQPLENLQLQQQLHSELIIKEEPDENQNYNEKSECIKEEYYSDENVDIKNHNKNVISKFPNDNNKNIIKPYKCTVCLKTFAREYYLNVHKRIHTGEKPYKCKYCNKQFTYYNTYTGHERTHNGERPYKCLHCGKCFSTQSAYICHRQIHNKEKAFKCDFCSKTFTLHNNLKVHLRIHNGERPYKCLHCDKCFSTQSAYICHRQIHNSEKAFKCDFCHKQFTLHNSLKVHLRIHNGERPYKCNVCTKAFTTKSGLNRHKKIHSVDTDNNKNFFT